MKSQSFDLYGGLLPAGFVSDNQHLIDKKQWPNNPNYWTGSQLKTLPSTALRLVGFELSISSFGPTYTASGSAWSGISFNPWSGLHVGVWLSWGDQGVPKEHDSVFAFGNTGDSGACNKDHHGLDIAIPSQDFFINLWAHNMRPSPSDWHTNGVLFYEETP